MEPAFRELIERLVGRDVWAISTIDHPYASPPDRVLSCHHRLWRLHESGREILPLVWDAITVPDNGLWRSAATLDTGLVGNHDRSLTFFDLGAFYPDAPPRPIDLERLSLCLAAAIGALTDIPRKLRDANRAAFIENFKVLAGVYGRTMLNSRNSHEFYVANLAGLYGLFGMEAVGRFVAETAESSYHSPWLRRYIASCIRETVKTEVGLERINDSGRVFARRLFRRINGADLPIGSLSLVQAADLVEQGELLYSAELFFWTLALAGIRHYGNDYGFFKRLEGLSEFSCVSNLQLTEQNKDADALFSFVKPRSFFCEHDGSHCAVARVNGIKATRVNTLTAAYLHLGREAPLLAKAILDGGVGPVRLDAGVIHSLQI